MRARTHFRQRGLTLFEVVIILALLLALLGLFLPLVQRIREAADRLKCTNNLHQIAIATHDFQATYNQLPRAIGPLPKADGDGTVFFYLLPYLEQDNLYNKGVDDQHNRSVWAGGVFSQPVEAYLCPSDTSGGASHVYQGWLATCSYAANYLLFEPEGATLMRIPDGLANTFMFSERYQICKNEPCAWAYTGETNWAPLFAYSNHGKFQIMPTQEQCDPSLPQTAHRTGIQVAMCDGSVHNLAPTMRAQTWYYACTPAGGELLTWPLD